MPSPRKIRRLPLKEFPYTRVIVISPHPDDGVLGCGGLLCKLNDSPHVHADISVFVMTPGYRGVDADFYEQNEKTGRENLERWPGLPAPQPQNEPELLCALRSRLGEAFDHFGLPGDEEDQKLKNIIRTAIRYGESRRDCDVLGLDPRRTLRFLALPILYDRRICPRELTRLRRELYTAADYEKANLVLVPHPDDPQPAHQVVTEAAIRALDPEIEWHIWYYQSPWHTIPPHAIDVVVSLNNQELYRKRAAAEAHQSQIDRTPYGEIVLAEASLNADVLPELVLGFGAKCAHALGKYCEVFQTRLGQFYTGTAVEGELLICSDERLPIDGDPNAE
ncbi:PIG-L deacetylase family protein [Planctomycetota bacterium]